MIEFARWDARAELVSLWSVCFQEPLRPVHFFFNNIFRPEDCLIYRVEEKAAAMVHFLPAYVAEGKNKVQAHYIYAAATLPEYRSHGHMARLLDAAALEGKRRGDRYSIVLPANPGLYRFYEKAGYKRGYSASFLDMAAEELQKVAAKPGWRQLPDFRALNQLRTEMVSHWGKSVLWSDAAFANAVGFYQIYGGRLLCVREAGQWAYAFCRMKDAATCEVTELMAMPSTLSKLTATLLQELPASRYLFRLPLESALFENTGSVQEFGMWKVLDEAGDTQAADGSYLGLPLD